MTSPIFTRLQQSVSPEKIENFKTPDIVASVPKEVSYAGNADVNNFLSSFKSSNVATQSRTEIAKPQEDQTKDTSFSEKSAVTTSEFTNLGFLSNDPETRQREVDVLIELINKTPIAHRSGVFPLVQGNPNNSRFMDIYVQLVAKMSMEGAKTPFLFETFNDFSTRLKDVMFEGLPTSSVPDVPVLISTTVRGSNPLRVKDATFYLQNEAQLDRFFRFFDEKKSFLFSPQISLGNKSEFQYAYEEKYPLQTSGVAEASQISDEGTKSFTYIDDLLSDSPELRRQQVADLCFVLQSMSIYDLTVKFDLNLNEPFFSSVYQAMSEVLSPKLPETATNEEVRTKILELKTKALSYLPLSYVTIEDRSDNFSDNWYFKIENCGEDALRALFGRVNFLDSYNGLYKLEILVDPIQKDLWYLTSKNFGESSKISAKQRDVLISFINSLYLVYPYPHDQLLRNYFILADLHSTVYEEPPINPLAGGVKPLFKAYELLSELQVSSDEREFNKRLSAFKAFFRKRAPYDFFFVGEDRFPKFVIETGEKGFEVRFNLENAKDLANFFHFFKFEEGVDLPDGLSDEGDQTSSATETSEQAQQKQESAPVYVPAKADPTVKTSLDTWATEPFIREHQEKEAAFRCIMDTPITKAKKWGEKIFVYTEDPKYENVKKAFDSLKSRVSTTEELTEKDGNALIAKVVSELQAVGINSMSLYIHTYPQKKDKSGKKLVERINFQSTSYDEEGIRSFVEDFQKIFTLSSSDFSKIRNTTYKIRILQSWDNYVSEGETRKYWIYGHPDTANFFSSLTEAQRMNFQDFLEQTPIRDLLAFKIIEEDEYLKAFFGIEKHLDQKPADLSILLNECMQKVYGAKGGYEVYNDPFKFTIRERFGSSELCFDMKAISGSLRDYTGLIQLLAFFRIGEGAFSFLKDVVSSCFDDILTPNIKVSDFLAARICSVLGGPTLKIDGLFVGEFGFKNDALEYFGKHSNDKNLAQSETFKTLQEALNLRGVSIVDATKPFADWRFEFANYNAATLHGFINLFTGMNQFFFDFVLERTYPLYTHVPGMLLSPKLRQFQEGHLIHQVDYVARWSVRKTAADMSMMVSAEDVQGGGEQQGLFTLEYVSTKEGQNVWRAWNDLIKGGTNNTNIDMKIKVLANAIAVPGCNWFSADFRTTYTMQGKNVHAPRGDFPSLMAEENSDKSIKLYFEIHTNPRSSYQYPKLYSFFDFFRMNSLHAAIPKHLFSNFFGGNEILTRLLENEELLEKVKTFFGKGPQNGGKGRFLEGYTVDDIIQYYFSNHSLKDLVMEGDIVSNGTHFPLRLSALANLAKDEFNGHERDRKPTLAKFFKPLYVRMLNKDGLDLEYLFRQPNAENFNELLEAKGFSLEKDFKLVQKSPDNRGPSGLFFDVKNLDSFFYYFGYTLDLPGSEEDLKVVLGEFGLRETKSFGEIALDYVLEKMGSTQADRPIIETKPKKVPTKKLVVSEIPQNHFNKDWFDPLKDYSFSNDDVDNFYRLIGLSDIKEKLEFAFRLYFLKTPMSTWFIKGTPTLEKVFACEVFPILCAKNLEGNFFAKADLDMTDVEAINAGIVQMGFDLGRDFKAMRGSGKDVHFEVHNLNKFLFLFDRTENADAFASDEKIVALVNKFGDELDIASRPLELFEALTQAPLKAFVRGNTIPQSKEHLFASVKVDTEKAASGATQTRSTVAEESTAARTTITVSDIPRPSTMPHGYSEGEMEGVFGGIRPSWRVLMGYVEPQGDDVSAALDTYDSESVNDIKALDAELSNIQKVAGYSNAFRLESRQEVNEMVDLRFIPVDNYDDLVVRIIDFENFFRFFKPKKSFIEALEAQRTTQESDEVSGAFEGTTEKPTDNILLERNDRKSLVARFLATVGDGKSKVLDTFLKDAGVGSLSEIEATNIDISTQSYDLHYLNSKINALVDEIQRLDKSIKEVNDSLENLTFERAEEENKRIAELVDNRASAIMLLEGTLEEFYKDKAPEDAAEEISKRYKKITAQCYTPTSYLTKTGEVLGMTQEQEEAMILMGKGIIAAGAGSGKTRVIAGRVVWLLREYDTNLAASQILATSFTAKASEELLHRINKFGRQYDLAVGTPPDKIKSILPEDGKLSSFGTTHSVTIGVLKQLGSKFKLNETIFDDLLKLAIQQVLLYPDQPLNSNEEKPSFAGTRKNLMGVDYQDRSAIFDKDIGTKRLEISGEKMPKEVSKIRKGFYLEGRNLYTPEKAYSDASSKVSTYWNDHKTAFQSGTITTLTRVFQTKDFDYRFISVYTPPSFVWQDGIHTAKTPKKYRFMDFTNSNNSNEKMKTKLWIADNFSIDYLIYKPLNRWYNIGAQQHLFTDTKGVRYSLEDIVRTVRFDYYKRVLSEMYQNLLSPEQAYYEITKDGKPKYTLDEVAIYAAFVDLRFNESAFLGDLSFDDVLVFGAKALLDPKKRIRDDNKTNLEIARDLYKHIMVDEAQDLNFVQHVFFDLLAGYIDPNTLQPYEDQALHGAAESFVFIGDDKQAIYEFRGADPSLFVAKSKMAPSPVFGDVPRGTFSTKLLVTNFRSGSKIVTAANNLIARNEDQIRMQCTTSPANGGGNIYQKANVDMLEYGLSLTKEISEYVNAGGKFSDYGVITRKNSELTPFVLTLESALIPTTSKIDLYDAEDYQSPFRKFYVWFDFIGLLLDRKKYNPSLDPSAWQAYRDTVQSYIVTTLWLSTPTTFGLNSVKKMAEAIKDHMERLVTILAADQTLADFLVASPQKHKSYTLGIGDAGASRYPYVREPRSKNNHSSDWQATSDLLAGLNTYLKTIESCINFAHKYDSCAAVTSKDIFTFFSNLVVDNKTTKAVAERYRTGTGGRLLMKDLYAPLALDADENLVEGASEGADDGKESVDLDAATLEALGLGGDAGSSKRETGILLYTMLEKIFDTTTPFSERIEYLRKRVAISKKKKAKDNNFKNRGLVVDFDAVLVDTGHQWKGLEAKYILAYMDDTFPLQEATLVSVIQRIDFDGRMVKRIQENYPKMLRADRRLAYVFLTRGQQEVRCLSKTSFCSQFLTEAGVPLLDDENSQKVPLFVPQDVISFQDRSTGIKVLSGFKILPMDSEGLPVVIQMQALLPKNKDETLPIFTENFMEQPESFVYKIPGSDILFGQDTLGTQSFSETLSKALLNRRKHLVELIDILEKEQSKLKEAIEAEKEGQIPLGSLQGFYKIKLGQILYWRKLLDRVTLLMPFALSPDLPKNEERTKELNVTFVNALKLRTTTLKNNLDLVANLRKIIKESSDSTQIGTKVVKFIPENMQYFINYFLDQSQGYTSNIVKPGVKSLDVFKQNLSTPLFSTIYGFLNDFLTSDTLDYANLLVQVRSLFLGLLVFEALLEGHIENYSSVGESDTDLKAVLLSGFLGGSTLKDPPSITVPAKVYVNVFGLSQGYPSCLLPNVDFTPDVSLYESFILVSASDYMKGFFTYFYKIFFAWLRLKPNDTNLSQITNKSADQLAISVADLNSAVVLRRLQTLSPSLLEALVMKFRKEFANAIAETAKLKGLNVSKSSASIETEEDLFTQKEEFSEGIFQALAQAVAKRAVDFEYAVDKYGGAKFNLIKTQKTGDSSKDALARGRSYYTAVSPGAMQEALRNSLTLSLFEYFTLGEIGGKNSRKVIRIQFDTFFGFPPKAIVRPGTSPYTLYGNIEQQGKYSDPYALEFNANFGTPGVVDTSKHLSSKWLLAEIAYNVPEFQAFVNKNFPDLVMLAEKLEEASQRLKGKPRRNLFKTDFNIRANPSNINMESLLLELPNKVVFGQEGRYVAISGHYETLLVSDKTSQAPQGGKRVFLDTFLQADTPQVVSKTIDPNLSNLEAWISSTKIAGPDLVLELPEQVSSGVYTYLEEVDQKLLDTLSKYKAFPKDFQKKLETNANNLLEGLSVMLELDLIRRELRVRNQVASIFNVDPKTAELSIANRTSSLFDKFARGSEIDTIPVEVSYNPAIENQLQKCICMEIALKDLVMMLDTGLNTLAVCSLSNIEKVSGTKQDFTLQDYVAFYPPRSNPPDLDFVCLITPNPLKMNNQ